MSKDIKKILDQKSSRAKIIKDIKKISDRAKATQETVGEVEAVQRVISDTLYIKDDIIVDLRNFSLTSISI